MSDVIGTCSLCGGPVKSMEIIGWNLVKTGREVKVCQICGATDKPHGPVIQMYLPKKAEEQPMYGLHVYKPKW